MVAGSPRGSRVAGSWDDVTASWFDTTPSITDGTRSVREGMVCKLEAACDIIVVSCGLVKVSKSGEEATNELGDVMVGCEVVMVIWEDEVMGRSSVDDTSMNCEGVRVVSFGKLTEGGLAVSEDVISEAFDAVMDESCEAITRAGGKGWRAAKF